MTAEQQRNMLECAAKACGYTVQYRDYGHSIEFLRRVQPNVLTSWNPLTNPADTAEMCARLDINTYWWPEYVDCTTQNISCDIPHDGTPEDKEAAWRLAASMVAAKVGGYADDI